MTATLSAEAIRRERHLVERTLRDAVGRLWLGRPGGRRAFAYPRVSSDRQAGDDRTGLLRGIQAMDTYAREGDLFIPLENVYADDYTGQEEIRPALDRLLTALGEAPLPERTVLVEEMGRLGRRMAVQYLIERRIKRLRGTLVSTREMDELTRLAFGFAAEVEALNISRRTRQANLVRMQQGRIISTTPRFGYHIRDRQFVIEPVAARTVRLVHDLFARNGSIHAVVTELLRREVAAPRGGRVWSQDTLLRLLRDETYAGRHFQNRYVVERTGAYTAQGKPQSKTRERPRSEWIPVAVPVIVPPGLFEANQRRLDRNRQRAGRPSRLQTLLRGLLLCGKCGRRMVLQRGNSGPQYYCPRHSDSEVKRNGQPWCSQRAVSVLATDEAVWTKLTKILLRPELLHAFLRDREGSRKFTPDDATPQARLASAERALERARELYDRELATTRGNADEALAALGRARSRYQQARAAVGTSGVAERVPTLGQLRAQLASFDAGAVSREDRHRIVSALLDDVVTTPSGVLLRGVVGATDLEVTYAIRQPRGSASRKRSSKAPQREPDRDRTAA